MKKEKGKHGGVRKNSGRKPKEKVLSNYDKAFKILDDDVEKNLNFLINVRDNKLKDNTIKVKVSMTERVRASQLLLSRTIPEKKEPERTFDIPFNPDFSNWSDEKLAEYVNGK